MGNKSRLNPLAPLQPLFKAPLLPSASRVFGNKGWAVTGSRGWQAGEGCGFAGESQACRGTSARGRAPKAGGPRGVGVTGGDARAHPHACARTLPSARAHTGARACTYPRARTHTGAHMHAPARAHTHARARTRSTVAGSFDSPARLSGPPYPALPPRGPGKGSPRVSAGTPRGDPRSVRTARPAGPRPRVPPGWRWRRGRPVGSREANRPAPAMLPQDSSVSQ